MSQISVKDLPAGAYFCFKRLGLNSRKCGLYEDYAGQSMKLYSYWDEGSRSQFVAFDRNGNRKSIPIGGAPGFTAEPAAWVPEEGDILIEYGTFCGKPMRPIITIYS